MNPNSLPDPPRQFRALRNDQKPLKHMNKSISKKWTNNEVSWNTQILENKILIDIIIHINHYVMSSWVLKSAKIKSKVTFYSRFSSRKFQNFCRICTHLKLVTRKYHSNTAPTIVTRTICNPRRNEKRELCICTILKFTRVYTTFVYKG